MHNFRREKIPLMNWFVALLIFSSLPLHSEPGFQNHRRALFALRGGGVRAASLAPPGFAWVTRQAPYSCKDFLPHTVLHHNARPPNAGLNPYLKRHFPDLFPTRLYSNYLNAYARAECQDLHPPLASDPSWVPSSSLNSSVPYVDSRFVSLFVAYVFVGGAHPSYSESGYFLDTKAGRRVAISELLDPSAAWAFRVELEATAWKSCKGPPCELDSLQFYKNFVVTYPGIVIPLGEIRDHATGQIFLLVTWDKLRSYLRPSFKYLAANTAYNSR